jgi:predicted transcriptional regulator
MAVDRLSVTVTSELGAALRALAAARGATVSTVVSEAIAHQVRLAALDVALAEADARFGALPAGALERAETDLGGAPQPTRRRRQRRR